MKPIYIFSLPRAGSTLLQRVIVQHPSVATTAEPWILLPIFSSLEKSTVLADYNHLLCSSAINQYIEGIQDGKQRFDKAVCKFALELYKAYCENNELYFIDKTPRYHLICDKIVEAFKDEARFIFIWRNPLAVVASVSETFCKGKWNLYRWNIDFYRGLDNLIATYKQFSDIGIAVQYESLLTGGGEWERVFRYLDLTWDSAYLSNIKSKIITGMGDPVGQHKYSEISTAPLTKWLKSYSSPLRRKWAKSYLQYIGIDGLKLMGYDYFKLIEELSSVKCDHSTRISDVLYALRDCLWDLIHIDAQKKRRQIRKQGARFYPWS